VKKKADSIATKPESVAAWMNRPLVRRATPPADPAGREAAALDELLSCAASLQRAFLNGEDERMRFLVFESALYGVEWLAARAAGEESGEAALLGSLLARMDDALNQIPKQSAPRKSALGMYHTHKARRAPVGSPMGGPKVDFTKPDNRTALELFGRIEAYRERWFMIEGTAAARKKLDPIPAACVALDDFGPATWRAWHEVGKMMLRADGSGASSHLSAAWQRLAKVHESSPLTALAWK
jgi:hypothetical protein